MLAIRNNLMAEGAARNLGQSYDKLATSVERLSSGLRINSAKDDAAGLAVRESIRADVAAIKQGSRNAMDGVSMLQAAEGGLGQIDAILVRMRELAEQASTETYSSTQKSIMQSEFNELANEISRISNTTTFNDINVTNSTGELKIGLGSGVSDSAKVLTVEKQDMTATALGLIGQKEIATTTGTYVPTLTSDTAAFAFNSDTAAAATITVNFGGKDLAVTFTAGQTMTLGEFKTALNTAADAAVSGWTVATTPDNVLTLTGADNGTATDITVTNTAVQFSGGTHVAATADFTTTQQGIANLDLQDGTDAAIGAVKSAIANKDAYRAKLGYWMNRLEYASSVLDVQAENLLTAESRISDVDVAMEMSSMTNSQVLAQAGVSMLAQANSMPQMALKLLG